MSNEQHAELLALVQQIALDTHDTKEGVSKINGRLRAAETNIARLDATCAARGSCAQKAGFVLGWKVGLMLAVAILVAGALMGTEGARALASVIKP